MSSSSKSNSNFEPLSTITEEQASEMINFFTGEEKKYIKEVISQNPLVDKGSKEN